MDLDVRFIVLEGLEVLSSPILRMDPTLDVEGFLELRSYKLKVTIRLTLVNIRVD